MGGCGQIFGSHSEYGDHMKNSMAGQYGGKDMGDNIGNI